MTLQEITHAIRLEARSVNILKGLYFYIPRLTRNVKEKDFIRFKS